MTEVTAEDALHIAQKALQTANDADARLDELESQLQEAKEELVAVKLRQQERDEDAEYQALSLDDKIGLVRQHAYRKAKNGHGRAMLDYNDIMWEVFDGEPGTKLCYKLIRLAAGLDDDKTGSEYPGFTARDPDGESYHLAVDADRAKNAVNLFPENKTEPEAAD